MPRNKRVKKDSKTHPTDQEKEQSQENTSNALQAEDKDNSSNDSFRAEIHERFQLPPDQFSESQNSEL